MAAERWRCKVNWEISTANIISHHCWVLTHFKYCAHSLCSLVFIGFIQRWNNVVDYSNDTYAYPSSCNTYRTQQKKTLNCTGYLELYIHSWHFDLDACDLDWSKQQFIINTERAFMVCFSMQVNALFFWH